MDIRTHTIITRTHTALVPAAMGEAGTAILMVIVHAMHTCTLTGTGTVMTTRNARTVLYWTTTLLKEWMKASLCAETTSWTVRGFGMERVAEKRALLSSETSGLVPHLPSLPLPLYLSHFFSPSLLLVLPLLFFLSLSFYLYEWVYMSLIKSVRRYKWMIFCVMTLSIYFWAYLLPRSTAARDIRHTWERRSHHLFSAYSSIWQGLQRRGGRRLHQIALD